MICTCKKGSESMGIFASEMLDKSPQNYFWFHPKLQIQCVNCRWCWGQSESG